VLTKVTAYSQWEGGFSVESDALALNVINRPDTDLFEVRDIQGLGPVNADINTTRLGKIPGTKFAGSSVGERNIVIKLGLTPDWQDWTISRLRKHLSHWFAPGNWVNLVFETMEFDPAVISGYVESNEPNVFSNDPEHQISIICPDLYFRSAQQTVVEGTTDFDPIALDYEGDTKTGFNVIITKNSGADPDYVGVRLSNPNEEFVQVDPTTGPAVDATTQIEINTVPGDKYIHAIPAGDPVINRLNDSEINTWPTISPGTVDFTVYSNAGVQDWVLKYYTLFGSL
jgi:Phage tail protein.